MTTSNSTSATTAPHLLFTDPDAPSSGSQLTELFAKRQQERIAQRAEHHRALGAQFELVADKLGVRPEELLKLQLELERIPPAKDDRPSWEREGPLKLQFLADLGWLDKEPPPRRSQFIWYRDNGPRSEPAMFMPAGQVCMIAAAGGAGKTQAGIHMAVSIATGRHCFGARSPLLCEESAGVLLITAEETGDELHRRIKTIATSEGLDDDAGGRELLMGNLAPMACHGLQVQLLGRRSDLAPLKETDTLHYIRAILNGSKPVGAQRWGAVVIDPASRFMPDGAERDSAAGTRFISALESLAQTRDKPTVIVMHHTNQDSRTEPKRAVAATAARGVTTLTDSTRWVAVLNLTEEDDENSDLKLTVVKSNYTEKAPALALGRISGGALTTLGDGESSVGKQRARKKAKAYNATVREEILRYLKGRKTGASGAEIKDAVPRQKQAVLAMIKQMNEERVIVKEGGKFVIL